MDHLQDKKRQRKMNSDFFIFLLTRVLLELKKQEVLQNTQIDIFPVQHNV